MSANLETLGIIAGSRSLPFLLARQAREMGVQRLVAVAFDKETDPALADLVDEIVWLKVGQLSKMIRAFSDRNVARCVMVGQIAPGNLFDLRPDIRAAKVLLTLKEKNAHTLFGAIADELGKDGVELIPATPWLQPLMPDTGYACGPGMTKQQKADAELGFQVAKEVSRMDIGQIVVVKNGTILAVEGFEGTDACLKRGGELAGRKGGAVAVKVAKKNHDLRFDIPCIGPQTIRACAEVRISALALEAGKTLLLEQESCEELARSNKLTVSTIG